MSLPASLQKCKSPTISRGLFNDDFYVMKSKMKNLKVLAEVKKICMIFLRKKTPFAALLAACLQMTRNRVFTLLLIKLGILYLVMGGSGLGPPNIAPPLGMGAHLSPNP